MELNTEIISLVHSVEFVFCDYSKFELPIMVLLLEVLL